MKRDYYELLGLKKGATTKEIKSAYRKKALEWHPDKNKSAEAAGKFKEINEAYEVLSDPKKKEMYDQYGHVPQGAPGGGPGGPFGGFQGGGQGPFSFTYRYEDGKNPFDEFGFSDPFEIFQEFFGMGGMGRAARKPRVQITLNFMEAYKGVEKEVIVDGKKKKIKIPAGVDDGSQIQFNEFNAVVSVKPDKTFLRQGADVIVDIDIPLFLAVAGGELEVPTPDGKTRIHLKPGTQAESVLRLSGLGMPSVRGGGHGNLYTRLHVKIPKWADLNPNQKKAIEELK